MRAPRRFMPCLVAAFAALALTAASAAAQTRGSARLQGKVVDEQGQPVADVVVRAVMTGQTEILSGKSDKKGEWRVNGLADGMWQVELSKAGLETIKETVEVKAERAPALNVTLKKPVVDPTAAINAELQKAAAIAQGGDVPGARKIYEELLVKYPQVYQLEGFIARTYAAENNMPKALEHLQINLDKEPANVELQLFKAELLMQTGDKVQARTILAAVDMAQVKDPYTFVNNAIGLINEGKGAEAADLLTKMIAQFPTQNDLYYYRGRAYVAAQKFDEARADLEKFVSLSPTAKEVADAKKILDQLKK